MTKEFIEPQLKDLKEAVESNSIESLRLKSREFINSYIEYQNQKAELRNKRITSAKKNIETIRKQLLSDSTNSDFIFLTHEQTSLPGRNKEK